MILDYRELTKLVSTYVDNMIPQIEDDGRLRTRFLQTGTVTGRMSSKDPNLQNIPTSGTYAHEIRECFIASPGTVLVAYDYSQVELRAAAMLSGDKKLVSIFREGRDIHSSVAEEVFGEETPDARRKAKVINFGILYGMGASALRKNLGEETTSAQDARSYLDMYFEKFSGLAAYLESVKGFVREHGYSKTLYGRRRYFPKINSKVPFIRAMEERMAINAPIQGTATADIIKLSMIDVDEFLERENLRGSVTMVAQIHDELIFEINEKEAPNIIPKIADVMESVLDKHTPPEEFVSVPIKVGTKSGVTWADLK